jgi:phage gp46-like protein
MDFALTIDDQANAHMTFNETTSLMNNIYLSLQVWRGSFFAGPLFGSRLHLLKRAKNTDQTAQRAAGYAKEALQWMIDEGRAKSVEVFTRRNASANGRMDLLIEVTPANGAPPVRYWTFIEVI